MSRIIHSIITAAGDSSETFLKAGFSLPKNLLVWEGKEILFRAVSSYAEAIATTTVALNRRECLNWNTASKLLEKYPELKVELISSNVPGALISALMAASNIPPESPLIVAAGDSEISAGISGYVQEFLDSGVDAGTIVFQADDPRWSYIATGPDNQVRQVAEKRVIGLLATTGVFYFRTVELFLDAAQWCLINNAKDRGLYYVSTTLNALIIRGLKVKYVQIPRHEYRSWSLPIDFIE
jgi:hypothetical protein